MRRFDSPKINPLDGIKRAVKIGPGPGPGKQF